jgi:hypothetical protein
MRKATLGERTRRLVGAATLRLLAAVAALALCGAMKVPAPVSGVGERLYREGQLATGEPLRGERAGAPPLLGRDAACQQCHRRSGLGMVEGQIIIPPIAGRVLFAPGKRIAPDNIAHSDATHLPATPPNRVAYDESTLARAIRDGIGVAGHPLDYLMPRFDLDDASMHELIAYLRRLAPARVPGVTDSELQFATIVTPDADPVARDGMLDVLEKYFAANNAAYYGGGAQRAADGRSVRIQRLWRLHVWRLSGAPETWEAQLDQRMHAVPVFAVVSGLGGKSWELVHRFCERQAVPCLLPNIDLPVVAADDFYPVYFSQGVLLEAQLIAARLSQPRPDSADRVRIFQVFRRDDIGAAAAARLRAALAPAAVPVDHAIEPGGGPQQLTQALRDVKAGDVLVLWLRAADLKALPAPPPKNSAIYLSGVMGGLEKAPLSPAWRRIARIAYPFELPEARSLRLNYALGWFHLEQIAVVDERVQVDTYIACSVLAQTLSSMIGEYQRDYLVERVEAMLSSRLVDGYYSRLGLAPGQHFASKGGYLVRFAEPAGVRVVADGDWIVP